MIECYDVIKIYSDPETNTRVAALRGIDLQIKKGELVSIIGPSGSGKSTFVKILAGMESISSGDVIVGNYELGGLTPKQLLKYRLDTVGLVHQFPERTLFLSGTVMDNMKFASGLYSQNKRENIQRSKDFLETLGIRNLADRKVSYLSGGEMIRTAIACMLAKNAPLLLCDEPTGQLDTENTNIVKSVLREICKEYGTTVLVVTHDMRFLKGVDRTCEIHSGRVSTLISSEDDLRFQEQTFPLKFKAQIDSSQSVRIPNQIYNLMRLTNNLEFEVTEDSTVTIKHPDNLPPKELKLEEAKKQKVLEFQPLPEDYFKDKALDLNLKNIAKIYGNKNLQVHALSEIDLQINKGEFAFIVGPSGSGKTTLIKLITGMEPSTNGKITVLDSKLHELNDKDRSKFRQKNIGIVSQQGNMHPFITVSENLFLKDIVSGKNINLPKFPKDELENVFEMFDIVHRKDAYPLEISGGELQRASLAIARFGTPGLLIFDEPTANMDSELAENVMDHLYELQEKLNVTMLISTHDINLVRKGTRVIELIDGKINRDGLAFPKEE